MDSSSRTSRVIRVAAILLLLGLYLTLRGYHSRDGDQAFRLPILLHQQSPATYANDPFVRAFDAFNPHRGYLALLDVAGRLFGLSFGIALLFVITFFATCVGVERLGRFCWPESGWMSGAIAVVMLLVAKAGNIGTNHLFEAMLLDRLIAMGLGWIAFGDLIQQPQRILRASMLLGVATIIHPAMGLQLGALAVVSLAVWPFFFNAGYRKLSSVIRAIGCVVVALTPGMVLMSRQEVSLTEGLSTEEFHTLSALIQSPQHMVPHLWRLNQWLAWACYPTIAFLSLASARTPWTEARKRTAIMMGLTILGLLAAWVGIEVLKLLSLTLFQPFRMATTARGLCLVLASDHVRSLWMSGKPWPRVRAFLIVLGLSGDLAFVVATLIEVGSMLGARLNPLAETCLGFAILGAGTAYLSLHDTESGQWCLLLGVVAGVGAHGAERFLPRLSWNPRRWVIVSVSCWAVPLLALCSQTMLPSRLGARLVEHCRFGETPIDDLERLAIWCRDHTPPDSRFVTPPGPKTFRLWSRREVAFNRASGPYHAAGLADWARRYQDHVNFSGSLAEFASAYLKNRQELDRRFESMDAGQKASLAHRQLAQYIVAASPKRDVASPHPSLRCLRKEGRYAVYEVVPDSTSPLVMKGQPTENATTMRARDPRRR